MDLNNFIILSITLLSLIIIFKKFNFLIDNIDFSDHKKIGIQNKSPIILGGIYLTFSMFFLGSEIYSFLKIICLLILFLGLSSDRNYLSNPLVRLILQVLIIFIFIYYENLSIRSISINFFDSLLEIKFVNIFFTLFCFAILMNGSNFLDGLNGLLSGYYLFVLGSLVYFKIGIAKKNKKNNFFRNFLYLS